MNVAIAVAIILLAESFGRDVVWQWRQHQVPIPARVETGFLVAAGSE